MASTSTRTGVQLAHSRGVTAIHDKDGWLGAPRIFQRLHDREGLTLRVWQSVPHEMLAELEALGLRSGFGDDFLRLGYLKVFMDGTLGSRTAWMLDGSGVRITSGDELAEIVRDGGPSGLAGRPCTRSATARTEKRWTRSSRRGTSWAPLGLRQRIEHAQCLAPEDLPRFARARRRLLGAVLATPRRTAISPSASGPPGSRARTLPLAPGVRRARRRTAPTRRSRSSTRSPGSGQASSARSTSAGLAARGGADGRGGAARDDRRRRRGSRATSARAGSSLPGFLADLVVLSRDPLAVLWTSSTSVEVVATMVGGRWVHNPPPWVSGRIDRKEGRSLFGLDPAAYDSARPGHAARVYEILVERCGLEAGTHVLEVGPGTGQASRRMLDLVDEFSPSSRTRRSPHTWRTRSAHASKCGSLRSRTPS